MKIKGAIVKEQGVKFAIVNVQRSILQSRQEQKKICQKFDPLFGGIPVVFMSQDSKGIATYVGRKDIVDFLSNVDSRRINWREFTSG